MSEKELLFSMTAADFEWSYTRGSGCGGQKRNKTSSAVHCMHKESGAHGYAEDTRSQSENKVLAFKRAIATKEFKRWHGLEIMRRNGQLEAVKSYVEKEIKKVKVEVKDEKGRWMEIDKNYQLS